MTKAHVTISSFSRSLGCSLAFFYSLGGIYGTVALLTEARVRFDSYRQLRQIWRGARKCRAHRQSDRVVQVGQAGASTEFARACQGRLLNEVPPSGVGDDEYKYRLDPQKGFVLEYFIGPNYQKIGTKYASAEWYSDQ